VNFYDEAIVFSIFCSFFIIAESYLGTVLDCLHREAFPGTVFFWDLVLSPSGVKLAVELGCVLFPAAPNSKIGSLLSSLLEL
jgi:hypothetical protein